MRQVISQNLTGRYAIIKIFPFIYALNGSKSAKRSSTRVMNTIPNAVGGSLPTKTFSILEFKQLAKARLFNNYLYFRLS